MQLYFKNCYLHNFDCQKVFEARYIIKNPVISWEYKEYDKINMKYRSNVLAKRDQDVQLLVVSHQ